MAEASVEDTQYDDETQDTGLSDEERNWKQLRKAREAAEKEASELRAQVKEYKLKAAGLKPDTPQWKIAMKAELDDDELAALVPSQSQEVTQEDQPETPDPDISDEEKRMTEVRRSAVDGAESEQAQVDNVYELAQADFEGDLKSGATQEEALARYISKINYAGQATDPRYSSQVDARPITEAMHREAKARQGII